MLVCCCNVRKQCLKAANELIGNKGTITDEMLHVP